jgi:hypothetical protein
MKPVMDEKIFCVAYYKGEPVGFWVNLPDLNQWFKIPEWAIQPLAQVKIPLDQAT